MSTALVTLERDKDTKNMVRYGKVVESTDYAVNVSVYVANAKATSDTITVSVDY
jgi:hypothetical protein